MTRRIRDPVHGLISFGGSGDGQRDEIDQIAWRLLDTPEFQRLRRIRQLGFSDLVFPGATHSRFAHSVGVYCTARRLADVIARLTKRDADRERSALLAALLHDIGHGPFSHAFEAVATAAEFRKRHEEWGAEIIQDDTGVNRVLREVDKDLPGSIGALLKDEDSKDIYSAIVSSQFDADRLDYIQRDRLMTGVQFGHIDRDWLFDCLEVGGVTIGTGEDVLKAPCLYLGSKGVQVAEEYLEARFRLYQMVYMHKTTRAAEKMLEALLSAAGQTTGQELTDEPVWRYLTSVKPSLGSYLDLDDATVWAALQTYARRDCGMVSTLAGRLRERKLYKSIDIAVRDRPGGNLLQRFRSALSDRPELRDRVLVDDAEVTSYKWYDFHDTFALKKVLVKTRKDASEPEDIIGVSGVVKALQDKTRIQRVYAEDGDRRELEELLSDVEGP